MGKCIALSTGGNGVDPDELTAIPSKVLKGYKFYGTGSTSDIDPYELQTGSLVISPSNVAYNVTVASGNDAVVGTYSGWGSVSASNVLCNRISDKANCYFSTSTLSNARGTMAYIHSDYTSAHSSAIGLNGSVTIPRGYHTGYENIQISIPNWTNKLDDVATATSVNIENINGFGNCITVGIYPGTISRGINWVFASLPNLSTANIVEGVVAVPGLGAGTFKPKPAAGTASVVLNNNLNFQSWLQNGMISIYGSNAYVSEYNRIHMYAWGKDGRETTDGGASALQARQSIDFSNYSSITLNVSAIGCSDTWVNRGYNDGTYAFAVRFFKNDPYELRSYDTTISGTFHPRVNAFTTTIVGGYTRYVVVENEEIASSSASMNEYDYLKHYDLNVASTLDYTLTIPYAARSAGYCKFVVEYYMSSLGGDTGPHSLNKAASADYYLNKITFNP